LVTDPGLSNSCWPVIVFNWSFSLLVCTVSFDFSTSYGFLRPINLSPTLILAARLATFYPPITFDALYSFFGTTLEILGTSFFSSCRFSSFMFSYSIFVSSRFLLFLKFDCKLGSAEIVFCLTFIGSFLEIS